MLAQIQEAHDQILREGIAKHRGYEIITEGDSFQVAFATCQAAIQFCLDVQYRLLEQSWSKEILKLHACRVVRGTTATAHWVRTQAVPAVCTPFFVLVLHSTQGMVAMTNDAPT